MSKDRAAPFSRKHRRYWIPVTGGMLLIGAINLAIGFYMWSRAPKDVPRRRHQPGVPFDANIDAPPYDDAVTPR